MSRNIHGLLAGDTGEATVAWETDSVDCTELHELWRPQRTLKPNGSTSASDMVLCVFYKNAFL